MRAVTVGQVTGPHLMANPGGRGGSTVMEGGRWEDWLQRKWLLAWLRLGTGRDAKRSTGGLVGGRWGDGTEPRALAMDGGR